MRYSDAKMTGSVSEAASGTATVGSRPALSGAVSDIILAVTERPIAPGETACFPFVARTAYGIPSIHEFNVISDNPNFNPEWVRLDRAAADSYGPHYILEVSPGDVGALSMALIRSVYRGEQRGHTATPKADARSS